MVQALDVKSHVGGMWHKIKFSVDFFNAKWLSGSINNLDLPFSDSITLDRTSSSQAQWSNFYILVNNVAGQAVNAWIDDFSIKEV
jgi:hypothetical protein